MHEGHHLYHVSMPKIRNWATGKLCAHNTVTNNSIQRSCMSSSHKIRDCSGLRDLPPRPKNAIALIHAVSVKTPAAEGKTVMY